MVEFLYWHFTNVLGTGTIRSAVILVFVLAAMSMFIGLTAWLGRMCERFIDSRGVPSRTAPDEYDDEDDDEEGDDYGVLDTNVVIGLNKKYVEGEPPTKYWPGAVVETEFVSLPFGFTITEIAVHPDDLDNFAVRNFIFGALNLVHPCGQPVSLRSFNDELLLPFKNKRTTVDVLVSVTIYCVAENVVFHGITLKGHSSEQEQAIGCRVEDM